MFLVVESQSFRRKVVLQNVSQSCLLNFNEIGYGVSDPSVKYCIQEYKTKYTCPNFT